MGANVGVSTVLQPVKSNISILEEIIISYMREKEKGV